MSKMLNLRFVALVFFVKFSIHSLVNNTCALHKLLHKSNVSSVIHKRCVVVPSSSIAYRSSPSVEVFLKSGTVKYLSAWVRTLHFNWVTHSEQRATLNLQEAHDCMRFGIKVQRVFAWKEKSDGL